MPRPPALTPTHPPAQPPTQLPPNRLFLQYYLVLFSASIICGAMPVLALALCAAAGVFPCLCQAVWVGRRVLLEDAHGQVSIRLTPLLGYAGERLKLDKGL